MADKGSAPKSLVKHSFAGIAAGGISTAILYPLDLVKTRYQIHENSPKAFRSLGQAFVSIVKTDVTGRYNFRALYQGMSPALYGTTLSWGLYFFFYEHAKSFYADQTILPPWVGHFASGIQAGAMCVPLTNPIWLVKVRMQVQATHPSQVPYKNMANALQRIAVEEGISALYKGVVPALFLTTHGAFKFVAYEWLKTEYNELVRAPLAIPQTLVMGALAQAFASTATYPYQVIKTRLQQGGPSADKYTGTWDCTKRIARHEGVRGFYKGLTPNLIKVLPTGALIFAVYEYVYQLLDGPKLQA
ncbi:hypothetical protein H310_10582 [Aphanomyces invadans]|uniref:Mitochondrial folate transporter/carrier n=1 Tax=Aphanomyces invadans TaxID=157072 RepID=A0A024TRI7_9STRA|nr:hypothetical protein H310_10582 [Aphanomyces invadans]ETV95917.1 hypothetical protein H310_10582 [Aphanomyces invadans]|eukprot:XP_008875228.1 hypothetical protein H310_10582 [Aphanomyces invadans]